MTTTTEKAPSGQAPPHSIAPRLRRRLGERAREIAADPEAEATAERLRAELAEHEGKTAAAERGLGAAALDRQGLQAATRKLDAVRVDATRVQAALDELERRRQEAEDEAWETAVSEERLRGYRWFMDYLDLVSDYLRKKAVADEAADRLRDIGELSSIRNFQNGLWGLPTETLFDTELLGATSPRPLSRAEELRRSGEPQFARLTVEECKRLREKVKLLGAETPENE